MDLIKQFFYDFKRQKMSHSIDLKIARNYKINARKKYF